MQKMRHAPGGTFVAGYCRNAKLLQLISSKCNNTMRSLPFAFTVLLLAGLTPGGAEVGAILRKVEMRASAVASFSKRLSVSMDKALVPPDPM